MAVSFVQAHCYDSLSPSQRVTNQQADLSPVIKPGCDQILPDCRTEEHRGARVVLVALL